MNLGQVEFSRSQKKNKKWRSSLSHFPPKLDVDQRSLTAVVTLAQLSSAGVEATGAAQSSAAVAVWSSAPRVAALSIPILGFVLNIIDVCLIVSFMPTFCSSHLALNTTPQTKPGSGEVLFASVANASETTFAWLPPLPLKRPSSNCPWRLPLHFGFNFSSEEMGQGFHPTLNRGFNKTATFSYILFFRIFSLATFNIPPTCFHISVGNTFVLSWRSARQAENPA